MLARPNPRAGTRLPQRRELDGKSSLAAGLAGAAVGVVIGVTVLGIGCDHECGIALGFGGFLGLVGGFPMSILVADVVNDHRQGADASSQRARALLEAGVRRRTRATAP